MEDDEIGDEDDEYDLILRVALVALVVEGPMPLSDLVAVLQQEGVLAAYGDLDHETLMTEIDELLLDSDDIWMSEDRIVCVVSAMLDGVNFTHRLSESEIARGVLDATPDIGVIDFDSVEGLEMTTGGILECHYPFEGEPEFDDNGSFAGPPGTLEPFSAGDLVCLKRADDKVSLEKIGQPGPGEAEASALRAAFENQHVEGLGVEPESLVMDALCHDPSLFRSPVLPVGELLEHIGLERRGAWFGQSGEDWAHPAVRYAERQLEELRESWEFEVCCDDAFEAALRAWLAFGDADAELEREEIRTVAKALAHGSVAPSFAEFILDHQPLKREKFASFSAQIAHAPGKLAAPALYFQALEAEQVSDPLTAEAFLRSSVLADPEYGPALSELAWYEADRGEGAKAISLLIRSGARAGEPELDYLSSLTPSIGTNVGRNDPCPCGSERKFKTCCINGAKLTIEQRAGWLYHKVIIFSLRPRNRHRVGDLIQLTNYGLDPSKLSALLPFLIDVGIFEGGGLEEFVNQRGTLLPEDELILVRTWLDTALVLWQVDEIDPGETVTLRNTRSGDKKVVTEHAASQSLDVGDYLLGRVVVVGSQHQIIGPPLEATLGQRERIMEMLDSEPDAIDIAMWLTMAFAPPRLTNRESEDMVLCRAVLRPRIEDWNRVITQLDGRYGTAHDNEWTETIDIDGENVVRARLCREGNDLVVETNSVERFDRLLIVLRHELDTDLEVIEEQRLTPEEAFEKRSDQSELAKSVEMTELPEEVLAQLAELIHQKELAWLDEQIPALGGLTPRQAADDPTRREDLIALLNEFDRDDDLPPGMVSFDVALLRMELGL
jgi:SEC-C motif